MDHQICSPCINTFHFRVLVLALAVILLVKCVEPKKADDKYILEVDSYDDIRENVINYDEEGAGMLNICIFL